MAPLRSLGNIRSAFDDFYARTGTDASTPVPFIASGGTTSTPGDGYKYHYFTHPMPGTYPLSPHPQTFSVDAGSRSIDVLLVSGGGGGGCDAGGGGGAGGVIEMSGYPISVGPYALGIGYGGDRGIGTGGPYSETSRGNPGGNTTGFSETALGGGGGGRGQGGTDTSATKNGLAGGSGGGGGGSYPGSGTQGSGGGATPQPINFVGSTAYGGTGSSGRNLEETGGGGGGASSSYPGSGDGNQDGGAGRAFPKFAGIVPGDPGPGHFAGGGGAGGWTSSSYNDGAGGAGGGGNGGAYPGKSSPAIGSPGTNNLGGGGGGGNQNNGGLGGSGIVIIRYSI